MRWANIDSLKTVKSDHLHLKSLDLRDQWIRRWKDWDIWEIMICHSRETREVNSIRWHSLLHRISSQILAHFKPPTFQKRFQTRLVDINYWNLKPIHNDVSIVVYHRKLNPTSMQWTQNVTVFLSTRFIMFQSQSLKGLTLAKAFPTTKQVLSSNWNIRLHWSWLSYCQTTYDDQNKLTKHFLKLFCSDMYNRDTISDWEKKAFTFRKKYTTTDF